MHDPMTVAFDIRYPWVKSRRALKDGSEFVFREQFITIWHVDPERDGSDDSCGYTVPRLTKRQLEKLRNVAWGEARNPYFLRFDRRNAPQFNRDELEALYRALILLVADTLDIPCTFEQAAREAATTIHHPDCIDRANVFCYLNGYHNNFPDLEDGGDLDRRLREDHFTGIMARIACWMLKDRRPWYRHPRWHVHHWKVVVHPWRKLRRWLFDRCGQCGRRFGWNESPVTYSWSGNGPCFHESCTQVYEATQKIIRESQAVA